MNSTRPRFAASIVWAPLPVVSWFLPTIGHTGISDSKGHIHDFSDDFAVTTDSVAFQSATKVYQFDMAKVATGSKGWNKTIKEISDNYYRMRHSFFFNNCHHYIASVLNKVKYGNRSNWTQIDVWFLITFKSRYIDCVGFLRQWWPFTIVLIVIIVFLAIAL